MRTALLGDLVRFVSGGTPSRSNASFFQGQIPWITGADIDASGTPHPRFFITDDAVRSSATSVTSGGTILLVTRTSVGKVGTANRPLCFSQDITGLTLHSDQVDHGYLVRYLRAQAEHLARQARGATIKGITREVVAGLQVPLPPLEEQRRIAAILDQADALRAKRLRVARALDGLPASVFAETFERREWPTLELSRVVREGTVVTYGIVQAGAECPGGVPYIRTGDLVGGQIDQPGLRRTDPMIAARFRRSTVTTGDIVMSIRATVGTTALVPPELSGANLTQGTARIAPGEASEPLFLLGYLRSEPAQRWIRAQIKGATFREITLARLRQLPVPLPPMAMQREYAAQVTATTSQREAAQRSLRQLDNLFASLQARAFSGQL